MYSALFLATPWLMLIGTVVFGETVILAAIASTATGDVSIASVVGVAFVGTMMADAAWFLGARRVLTRWGSSPEKQATLERARRRLQRFGRPELAMIVAKFFYGTRIAAIVVMASSGVRTWRFLSFNAIGTVLWLVMLVPFGMGVGAGFQALGIDSTGIWAGLTAILVGVAAVKTLSARRGRRNPNPPRPEAPSLEAGGVDAERVHVDPRTEP